MTSSARLTPLPAVSVGAGVSIYSTGYLRAGAAGWSVAEVEAAFVPSDVSPALLTLRAGKVLRTSAGEEIRPVGRLDVVSAGLPACRGHSDGRDDQKFSHQHFLKRAHGQSTRRHEATKMTGQFEVLRVLSRLRVVV